MQIFFRIICKNLCNELKDNIALNGKKFSTMPFWGYYLPFGTQNMRHFTTPKR